MILEHIALESTLLLCLLNYLFDFAFVLPSSLVFYYYVY